jgi:hypothetical protein
LAPRKGLNAKNKLAPRVANWPLKFDGNPFSALGPIEGHKVQHLLVLWGGQIEKFFFSISALTPSVKALGADFNFLNQ